jgi:hypothetical protein
MRQHAAAARHARRATVSLVVVVTAGGCAHFRSPLLDRRRAASAAPLGVG